MRINKFFSLDILLNFGIILLLMFLSQPFIIWERIVFWKICLTLGAFTILFYNTAKNSNFSNGSLVVFSVLLFYLIYNLFRSYAFNSFVNELYNVLIIYLFYLNKFVREISKKILLLSKYLIPIFSIFSLFALLFFDIFHQSQIREGEIGYETSLNNIFLGRFFTGFIPGLLRYSFFFNEPSYFGFFFGLALIVLFELELISRKVLLFQVLLLLIINQSGSFALSSLFYLVSFFFIRKNPENFNLRWSCVFIILLVLIYTLSFVNLETFVNLFSESFLNSGEVRSLSYFNRFDRASNFARYLQDSNWVQLFFGNQFITQSALLRDGFGISNGLIKLFHDFGLLGLLLFCFFISYAVNFNIRILVYIFIGAVNISILLTPVLFFIVLSIFKSSNSK